jgi:hypothetical protein
VKGRGGDRGSELDAGDPVRGNGRELLDSGVVDGLRADGTVERGGQGTV